MQSLRSLCRFLMLAGLALAALAAGRLPAHSGGPPGLEGRLQADYVCGGQQEALRTRLRLEDGRTIPLGFSPAPVDLARVAGRRVAVDGEWLPAAGGAPPAFGVRQIGAAAPLGVEEPAGIGSKRCLVILCRFADRRGGPLQTVGEIEALFGDAEPGLGHYFRAQSDGVMDVAGSRVVGWYTLPRGFAAYRSAADGVDLERLLRDALALADADVFFPDFWSIMVAFNAGDAEVGWSGRASLGPWHMLTLDGETRDYRTAWLPTPLRQASCAHELGHNLGMPHSSGPYRSDYDSRWDMMSAGSRWVWNGGAWDRGYALLGAGTIAFHRRLAGWLPDERRRVVPPGTQATFDLDPLDLPSPSRTVMVEVTRREAPQRSFTVEARRTVGYDTALPGTAVLIHDVDPDRKRAACVVDPDRNGNPNDAGAIWLPGETFSDPATGIRIGVSRLDASGARVVVSNNAGPIVLPRSEGKLSIAPAALNFGTLAPGKRSRLTVTITNSGSGPLTGSVGSSATPFSVASGAGAFSLAPAASRAVELQFAPARRQPRAFTGRLPVSSSDPARRSVTVAVSGLCP